MSRYDRTRVLEVVCEVVPRVVDELIPLSWRAQIGRGACLTATRVGMETLRYFGIECRPLLTKALATNAEWIAWAKTGAVERGEPMPDDCWSVAIGMAPVGGGGLDAHAVVEVNRLLLLDLDARQFTRRERGIVVPETVCLPFVRDERGRWCGIELEGGGNLTYAELKSSLPFRSAKDWKRASSGAGKAIREVRARLADAA